MKKTVELNISWINRLDYYIDMVKKAETPQSKELAVVSLIGYVSSLKHLVSLALKQEVLNQIK